MVILPKAIYRFSAIFIKLPVEFSTELKQKISNLYGNIKDPKSTFPLQTILQSYSHQNSMVLAQK